MNMIDYSTLHFDTNSSKRAALVLLVWISVIVGSSTIRKTLNLK